MLQERQQREQRESLDMGEREMHFRWKTLSGESQELLEASRRTTLLSTRENTTVAVQSIRHTKLGRRLRWQQTHGSSRKEKERSVWKHLGDACGHQKEVHPVTERRQSQWPASLEILCPRHRPPKRYQAYLNVCKIVCMCPFGP